MTRRRTLLLLGLGLLASVAADTAGHGQGTRVPEQHPGHRAPGWTPAPQEMVDRGKYLTDMGDCVGCHSANGGKEYAGGRIMGLPFGGLSTPNITADVDTGIGTWTDAQYLELMRNGVAPDGTHIYPAMPYAFLHTVSTDDLLAIKAYLFSLDPVNAPRVPSDIWFPATIRPAIAVWNWLFVPDSQFTPDPRLTAEQNRGSYIVNGLEHCGACHNNRNLMGNGAASLHLQGGPITRWYAPSLQGDKVSGLGRYSDDDLFGFFKEGHSPGMGTVVGPMSEVVDYSTSKLSDADLRAIIAYLRTQPSEPSYVERKPRPGDRQFAAGENTYLSHCASCHGVDGKGVPNVIPALDGNGMVRAYGPQSVIGVVIGGVSARGPYAIMPGVGADMSDQQIADAVNYVRQAWSNAAPANATALQARLLRHDNETLENGQRPGGCPDLAQGELQRVLDDKSNGVDAALHAVTPATVLQSANTLVSKVRQAAPDLPKADLVNGLTIAYCPIVNADPGIPPDKRHWWLMHFAERIYVQFSTGGAY